MSDLEKQRMRWERKGAQEETVTQSKLDERDRRRVFVKSGKTGQMRQWLTNLRPRRGQLRAEMSEWEFKFYMDMARKFEKYAKVKWVTEKQYRALERIAIKYVTLPGGVR